MWRVDDPQGSESLKIRWELVPFTRGRVLDLGCGPHKTFPHFIGVDNCHHEKAFGWAPGTIKPDVHVETCEKLEMFASRSCDAVFSSHLLEHIVDYRATLREWWRVIKVGGYLCLYLPHKLFYPNIGHDHANEDHKHDFMPKDIVDAMFDIGGVDVVEDQDRNGTTEYSFFQVYRKRSDKQNRIEPGIEGKTAAVVRYGAFGDLMQTSSILPGLKRQGYHVTLYTVPRGYDVVKHDPNIDRFIIEDVNQVPNENLGEFWAYTARKYDKFINLSESVEGTFLAIQGRASHEWPHAVRHKYLNRNYMEFAHALADVPMPIECRFYPTPDERRWARHQRGLVKGPVILWSLSGSSIHKAWPHADTVMARILHAYPTAVIVTVGDGLCKILERGWERNARVWKRSGEWSIRESMSFCEVADLIIGTETGLLNAAALLDVPKIVIMSHSSVENLTRDWKNTASMEPEMTPCYPCHRMHYSWTWCHQEKTTHAALCQFNVSAPRVWKEVVRCLGEPQVDTPDDGEAQIVIHDNRAMLRDNINAAIGV